MKSWLKVWFKYLFRGYPSWSRKLECKKCRMSFISAEAHFEHVMNNHG